MPRYPQTERLLAEMTRVLRGRGYSVRTQDTYVRWVARFMRQAGHPHPGSLDQRHVESFLHALANESRLSPKTRNQAASALAFLYREVLHSDAVRSVKRAKGRSRVPTVLSHREACAVLAELTGQKYLVAALMYGTGLRVSEALSLRIKDLDFDMARIVVHDGKGGRGRVVMLPEVLVHGLTRQVRRVRAQHERDLGRGGGCPPLPDALATKKPSEGFSPGWQYLFPARKLLRDPMTRRVGRGPLHPSAVQRAVRSAVRRAGILKPATCHTFRHSFATQLLRNRYDIRVVQELLGHKDIRTTMIYLHVADQAGAGVRSPLDEDPPDRRSGAGRRGGEDA